jgi:23S rRNA (uracil1939-C5)-methyltransferase
MDLDIEKLENTGGRATYAEIMDYVKEKYGFSIASSFIAQVKGKAGLEKRLNYHHGSGNGRVAICPPEKKEAIMDAFRHFNLI